MLEVEDLKVGFVLANHRELRAVSGISFTVERGERFALVGESGCGKSTTVLALMGLLPPNAWVSGRLAIDGHDLLTSHERRMRSLRWTHIAMVPQGAMNALNPVQRVGRQIAEPILLHGVAGKRRAAERAAELLELVGIPARFTQRYPHELSGGMRQRATIAMALACSPKVLLADEPTTALDVIVQAQILELLESLCQELQLALVLVTHDLGAVAQLCTRAAVMYEGKFVEVGEVEELYHSPSHPYTARLFAATPSLRRDSSASEGPAAASIFGAHATSR
jgi:ABC-type dipeptide/oligopeptide/nickel transport system ATPase component